MFLDQFHYKKVCISMYPFVSFINFNISSNKPEKGLTQKFVFMHFLVSSELPQEYLKGTCALQNIFSSWSQQKAFSEVKLVSSMLVYGYLWLIYKFIYKSFTFHLQAIYISSIPVVTVCTFVQKL